MLSWKDRAAGLICLEMLNNIITMKVLNSDDTQPSVVPNVTENK